MPRSVKLGSHLRLDLTNWLGRAVRSGRSGLVGRSRVVTRKCLTCQKYSCSGRVVKWSGSDRVSIVPRPGSDRVDREAIVWRSCGVGEYFFLPIATRSSRSLPD